MISRSGAKSCRITWGSETGNDTIQLGGSQFLPLSCVSFNGIEEFRAYRDQNGTRLATRWLYERSLSSTSHEFMFEGTCGVCLHPARFTAATAGGEMVGAGRVPNWRETLACNCESRLVSRERSVLQFLIGNIGLPPWSRILVLGKMPRLSPILKEFALEVVQDNGRRRATMPTRFHLAVALETLHMARDPIRMLRELGPMLAPGGQFVFTMPFHSDCVDSEITGELPHKIGWDILHHARDAGFRSAVAQLYWSEELGYLGSPNFLFVASR